MKHLYAQILAAVCCIASLTASAQKHTGYADLGIVLNSPHAGASVTYNYKPAKRIGVGIGAQGYLFDPTKTNNVRFVPAVYADARLSIRPAKSNQFFALMDIGMHFYKADISYYRSKGNNVFSNRHNNGVLFGLGVGYLRRLAPRGTGVYASLKLMTNNYTVNRHDPATLQQVSVWLNSDFNFVASVGIRY